ncbi:MAG: lectin [Gammaproteobacteria bacterium]
MKKTIQQITLVPVALLFLSSVSGAQEVYPLYPDNPEWPSDEMTFFVTSEPIGDGGNLGGLEGADAHCQSLAAAVGHDDKTWRAYLSTQERPGQPAVNARDRIGEGPWFYPKAGTIDYLGRNLARPIIMSQMHGDTLEEAQRGSNMIKAFALTEKGDIVNGIGDPLPTRHDILTGSQTDGRAFPPGEDRTCNNWTSNGEGAAQVGHSDRIGNGNTSWNSSHATTGCSQEELVSWGGVGLFYCFAID